jgi:hypothetical protein
MARVLVERPRRGPRVRLMRSKRHQVVRSRPEIAPRWEAMSRGRGTKWLSENLAPLGRFLERQVGRPWDAVYAEISARLRPRSAVQQHVRDHVGDFVATVTWVEGDEILGLGRWGAPVPLRGESWAPRFYVCPRSGILRARRRKRQRRRFWEPDPDVRWDGPSRQLRKIDGIWYALDLAPLPSQVGSGALPRDRFLKQALSEILRQGTDRLLEAYGRADVYAAAKRQLSKRELRSLEKLPMGSRRVGS